MGPAGFLEVLEDAALQLPARASSPASRMQIAAFSQRMPPVQKLTTVLPSSCAVWASQGLREVAELLQAPVDRAFEGAVIHLEGVAGVQQ